MSEVNNVELQADPIEGSAWVFGDEMNTDNMAPGIYFKESIEVLSQHCLGQTMQ